MKTKRRTWVFVAEIIALLIFIFFFIKYGSDKINPDQVFAYSRNIVAGETIEETDLISVPISSMTRTADMITISEYASIVGKKAATNVYVNNIAYRSQLTDIDTQSNVINQDLSNKVLYSMPFDYIEGFAGNLKTGDTIDLLFTSTGSVSDGENENSFIYSKIFMRDIMIYNVNTGDGYKFVDHSELTESQVTTGTSETDGTMELTSSAPASITLILTPEQAEQLDARRVAGTIKFVKRFEETQTHETLGFVIGNYGKIFSGNANAETGNLQIVDSYTDDDPNGVDSINTSQGGIGNTSNNSSNSDGSNSGTGYNNSSYNGSSYYGSDFSNSSDSNDSGVTGIATGTTVVG